MAGCTRGFYNPLQRRHCEGAVPGLRTLGSLSSGRQRSSCASCWQLCSSTTATTTPSAARDLPWAFCRPDEHSTPRGGDKVAWEEKTQIGSSEGITVVPGMLAEKEGFWTQLKWRTVNSVLRCPRVNSHGAPRESLSSTERLDCGSQASMGVDSRQTLCSGCYQAVTGDHTLLRKSGGQLSLC